jgi:F0F1-type ATP synthase delta subunit
MKAAATNLAKAFVTYLKDEEQYVLLPEIVQELQDEVLRNQDISVIAATELSTKEQAEITKELTEKWGDHRVIFTVDPTILSGIIVRFQDIILDLSGKQGLRDLKETLIKPV